MIIEENRVGDVYVVSVDGRLDATTWQSFHNCIIELFDKGEKKILIDFSKVEYISSLGLRALILAGRKMNSVKGKLVLCSLQKSVQDVFEVSGFTSLFPTFGSSEEAIQNFS